jgi:hypothetical protein
VKHVGASGDTNNVFPHKVIMIETRMQHSIATILFFLCVLLILAIPIKTPFNLYDEGFAVFNATRIIHGDMPHQDFWAVYPPGQFYAIATVFRILGANLIAARIYDIFIRFIIVIIIYFIGKKITSCFFTLASCFASTLLLGSCGFYTYAVFPSLALGLLSILSLLQYPKAERQRWLILSGFLAGVATWFRLDVGLYTGISVGLTVVLFGFHRVAHEKTFPNKGYTGICKTVLWFIGGLLFAMLPFYGYLGIKGDFSALWTQVVIFPATKLHDVRRLSCPALIPNVFHMPTSLHAAFQIYAEFLSWLLFYFPLAIYGLTLFLLIRSFHFSGAAFNAKRVGTISVTLLGLLLFAQALSRYDYIHVIPTSIFAALVVAALMDRHVLYLPSAVRSVVRFPLLAVAILCFFQPIKTIIDFARGFHPLSCHSRIERAGGIALSSGQENAVEFIKTHTRKDEPIFVGNQSHDRIFVNDIGFYFLADRPSPGIYSELHPGIATTLPVQRTIVGDIVSRNVHWIVLVDIPAPTEPNASARSSGVFYLDEFIRSHYVKLSDLGPYVIWQRVVELSR